MNGDLQHIDDLFKSGIEGKEETPSPSVWDNIEKELDKKDSRPKFLYWWNTRRIAAAVLILLGSAGLFAGGYYLGTRQDNKKQTPSGQQKQQGINNPVTVDAGTIIKDESVNELKQPDRPGSEPGMSNSSSSQGSAANTSINRTPRQQEDQASVSDKAVKSKNLAAEKNTTTAELAETKRKQKSISTAITTKAGTGTAAIISKTTSKGGKTSSTLLGPGAKARSIDRKKNDQQVVQTITASENERGLTNEFVASGRIWKPESPTQPGSVRDIPEVTTQISPAAKVSTPVTEFAASSKSIPVLNKRKTEVDLPRFSLTPVAGLQFGSNRIVANGDPNSLYVKTDIDRTESQPMSINGGILADLKIARNITLQSGLIFASRNIEIEPKYIKAERNPDGKVRYKFDCSAGTYYIKKSTYARPGDSAMTIFSTNELNYLNIPLALTYHFGGKKFHLFASAGAGINLLTDQYLETGLKNYNYDASESITTNLKSSYFNGMIGAGVNYRPFKKISFLFSPQYQFAITPMNENMPVKAYPRIFNMQLGMQIRL